MTADEGEKPKYTPGPNAIDITPDKDGGVLKEIIKEGVGEIHPSVGCTVKIHYHGTLLDGTVFDSSKESNKPFKFVLGKEVVIKAWNLGVATMKKGEIALFTCKPEYACGKIGSPPKVPPSSILIFEITLLSWEAEDISKDKDKGILRTIIQKGKGYPTPNSGALVEVHLTGIYEDKVFEDRDVSFNLGEGSEHGVIEGIEMALTMFTKEEKSRLQIKPKYAFQQEGHKEFGIPPDATVTYIVELKNFERAKNSWDMDASEKISQCILLKEKATNYFRNGKYDLAVKLYDNAVEFINTETGFSKEENTERKALLLAVKLNLALVYLKMNEGYQAKKECDCALELDSHNIKGLFRRGQAYLILNEPENAKLDFEAVCKLEPTNKLAANQIMLCRTKIKQQREKEKKIYANMFEKFAQKDKEQSAVRFGWWDDEAQKPVIEKMQVKCGVEDAEYMKAMKKSQLENLRKMAEARRRELESQKSCSDEDNLQENPEKEESVKEPDTMKLGEWGKDERDREPTEFEQENPDILMLNKNDEFKNM